MKTNLTRAAAKLAAAAITAGAAVVSLGGVAHADPLPPGAPAQGAMTITPSTGTGATSFQLSFLPAGTPQFCPGNADLGYNVNTFITPYGTDLATLTYNGSGMPTNGTGFTSHLWDAGTYAPMAGLFPAPDNYQIGTLPFATFDLVYNAGEIPAGLYSIGVACVKAGQTERYWTVPFNVTENPTGGTPQISWSTGLPAAAPTAPTGVAVTPGATENSASVAFNAVTANPAVSSYTATFTSAGNPTVTVSGTGSPLAVTGLVPAATYSVTVTATNAQGTSPASAPASYTNVPGLRPAVTGLDAVAQPGGDIDVTWTAPTGTAPTGYDVSISPADAPAQTLGASATSATFTGLTAGTTYAVTVTPTHPAPFVAASATDTVVALASTIIIQDLEVDRPVGALVFTQRCGVNDEIPAIAAGAASPSGFKGGLPLVADTADEVGTMPTGETAANFDQYPYPVDADGNAVAPTYPTHCGVEFAPARLVTEQNDPYRGMFFRTSAIIDEITVVDTTDGDAGWTLGATASAFTDGAGQTFSGDYLGWQPVVSWETGVTPDLGDVNGAYNQNVSAGSSINPATPGGLGDGATLANAPAGGGLGISEHNARLMLLIPLTADSGSYSSTLTYTVA